MRKKISETGLKTLTPDKSLTRLPILLAQTKAGNNSNIIKDKIRKIVYLLYQHSKINKKFATISSSHYNDGRKYNCDKRLQTFFFLVLIGLKMLMRT